MCTVLIAYRSHPASQLIVAANRDEFFGRPATGPIVLRREPMLAIGGRDLVHRGTWLGLNDRGFFAALTNIRCPIDDRRSRGELVSEILAAESAEQGDSILRDLMTQGRYRPFNLIYGSVNGLHVARQESETLSIEDVPEGLHVLASNGVLNDPALPGIARGHELLANAAGANSLGDTMMLLKSALADHQLPMPDQLPTSLQESPLGAELEAQVQALCVHTEVYGTRSSNVLICDPDRLEFHATEVSPCVGEWKRYEGLLST